MLLLLCWCAAALLLLARREHERSIGIIGTIRPTPSTRRRSGRTSREPAPSTEGWPTSWRRWDYDPESALSSSCLTDARYRYIHYNTSSLFLAGWACGGVAGVGMSDQNRNKDKMGYLAHLAWSMFRLVQSIQQCSKWKACPDNTCRANLGRKVLYPVAVQS